MASFISNLFIGIQMVCNPFLHVKYYFLFFILFNSFQIGSAQTLKTSGLFERTDTNYNGGHLNFVQDPIIDSLIMRYILRNKNKEEEIGYPGTQGFRIQIYNSMDISAKMESSKIEIEFNSQFPGIITYRVFAAPRWYKVRVGNYRSKAEAIKPYLLINQKFPNSDIVPDIINLNDMNK